MTNPFYLSVADEKVQIVAYVPKAKRSAYNELAGQQPGSLSKLIECLLDQHFAAELKETVQKFLPSSPLITDVQP